MAWTFFLPSKFLSQSSAQSLQNICDHGQEELQGTHPPRPLTRQLRSADLTRHTGKEQERRRRRPRRRAGWRRLERLSRHPQGEREASALLRHPAPAPRGGEECLLGGSQTRAPQQLQVLRFQRVRLTCRGVANCPANLDRHTVTPSPSRASFRPDTSPRSSTSSTRMVALSSPPSLCLGTPTIWLGG